MDIQKGQYRAARAIIRSAASALGLSIHSAEAISTDLLGEDDLLLVPPYGSIINHIRAGWTPRSDILMLDLSGPAGIDSALMVNQRKFRRFCYASPMVGQPRFDAWFAPLIEARIPVYPFPFTPAAAAIEVGNILDHLWNENKRETQPANGRIVFAGAVWGRRSKFLQALREAIGDNLLVVNGLPSRGYLKLLSESTAALDFAGENAVTYRFSEIMLAPCACIAERRPFFVLARPPKEREEVVTFSTVDELRDAARDVLASDALRTKLRAAGSSWYMQTQNPSELGCYMLAIGKGHLREPAWPIRMPIEQRATFWSVWETDR